MIDRIEIAAMFESGLAEVEQLWPHVRFDVEAFAAFVHERIVERCDLPAMLPRLRVADLFLAWWALCSDDGIAEFESVLAYNLHRIVARFPFIDPVVLVETIRVALFVGGEDGPRIAEYTGFGALRDWVDVVVAQICIDATHVALAQTSWPASRSVRSA